MSSCCGTVISARARRADGTSAFQTLSTRIANRFTIESRPGSAASYAPNRALATLECMLDWIWVPALYVLAFGLFAWLGGITAAGDAIARWGRETAERRRCAPSPCS